MAQKAGHTAGYAVAEPGVDCVGIFGPEIEGGDREVVASVWFIDGDEESAMKLARQFAAAPDYDEGARAFVEYEEAAERGDDVAAMLAYAKAAKLLRAALSKAEGRS